jgi:hypothetical protein
MVSPLVCAGHSKLLLAQSAAIHKMHGARGLLPEPPGSANACGKCGTVSLSLQVQYLPVAQQKRAAARTKLRPFVQGPCIHNIKLGSLSSTISHVPASSKANAARGDPSNPGDRVKTPRSAVAREAQPLKQSASEHPSVHKGCDPDALPAADPSAGAATPYTAASKQPSQSSQSVQSAQQAQPKQQAETSTSYRKPTSVATEKEVSSAGPALSQRGNTVPTPFTSHHAASLPIESYCLKLAS